MVIAASSAFRYRDIASRIIANFSASHADHPRSDDAILTSQAFHHWLTSTFAPTIVRSTWRLYRASLAHYSAAIQPTLPALYRSLPITAAPRTPNSKNRHVRTSSQRQRSLPPEQLAAIVDHLAANSHHTPSAYAAAIGLLSVGPYTGLRPIEWRTARLSNLDDRPTLVVQNAKHTHGRSHGPTRTLYIDRLPDWVRQAIADLIDLASPRDRHDWLRLCRAAQDRVATATRRLYPAATRHPTIYSARHQAVLNMREAGYTLEEIAAALGHINPRTATRNYGRRRNGRGGAAPVKLPIVAPTADDIARVHPAYPTTPATATPPPPQPESIQRLINLVPASIQRG